MDVLSQVQGIVVEHAFTIGIALLVTLVIAGIVWFSMSRSASGSKNDFLENQARMDKMNMSPGAVPISQEHVEENADSMMEQPSPIEMPHEAQMDQ
jgi:hypothetical protein